MTRTRKSAGDLETIQAERARLEARLQQLSELEHKVTEAARDAGREALLLALQRVTIAAMTKGEANSIARSITRHGGAVIAAHVTKLEAGKAEEEAPGRAASIAA